MNGEMVLVYDGDCAFCSASVRFLERRVSSPARYIPWQRADLDKLGLTPQQCDDAVQWVAPGEPVAAGPDAVAALLSHARGVWRLIGRILLRRWVSQLAWPVYHWVSRHRHQLPGGTPACAVR